MLTERYPTAALGSGMRPPLTLTYLTHLPQAVSQQPPITSNNASLRLHLAPLLNPRLQHESAKEMFLFQDRMKQSKSKPTGLT